MLLNVHTLCVLRTLVLCQRTCYSQSAQSFITDIGDAEAATLPIKGLQDSICSPAV